MEDKITKIPSAYQYRASSGHDVCPLHYKEQASIVHKAPKTIYDAPKHYDHKMQADNSMLALQPTLENATMDNSGVVGVCMLDLEMYSKRLRIRVRPHESNPMYKRGQRPQTIGLLCFRVKDGHKDLYLFGKDNKLHLAKDVRIPQSKHTSIPKLASALGLSREWVITLD